mgnify:CR=1 FL=1
MNNGIYTDKQYGNETGVNSLWIPGEETSDGVPEAVLNTVPLDMTRVSRIGIK